MLRPPEDRGWSLPHGNHMKADVGGLCWLVVWNIHFIFPYTGNNHPNWLLICWWWGAWLNYCSMTFGKFIIPTDEIKFVRGVGIPPTRYSIEISVYIPSDDLIYNYGKSPCFQWVSPIYPLFLWPFFHSLPVFHCHCYLDVHPSSRHPLTGATSSASRQLLVAYNTALNACVRSLRSLRSFCGRSSCSQIVWDDQILMLQKCYEIDDDGWQLMTIDDDWWQLITTDDYWELLNLLRTIDHASTAST